MPKVLANIWVWVGLFVLCACAGGAWWYLNRGPQLDALMREAFDQADAVVAYAQAVETETMIEDRRIRVLGDYRIDDENKRYSSRATTTLTLPDGTSHSFTLHTVTIGEDMFTKVQSHSAGINLTVPSSPDWKKFRTTSIPTEYREIATPRPPLDNIALFRSGGKFLVINDGRRDESMDGEMLAHYTFNLSSRAFTEETGPVSMIAERVGVHGTIDVWVHEGTATIRRILLSNDPYFSTTTLRFINALPRIENPSP